MPEAKSKKAGFLPVFQIKSREATTPAEPTRTADGAVHVADWRISAALDSSEPASLLIERVDGGAALAVDCPAVSEDGTQYRLSGSESLLVEDSGKVVRRCGDEISEAAR